MKIKKLLTPFLLTFIFAHAGLANRIHHPYAPNGLFSLYTQAGFFAWDAQPGQLSIKFPYTITSPTAAPYHGNFSANINNLVGTGRFYYSLLGVEFGKNNFAVDMNYSMGSLTQGWSDNFYVGMSYRLHFGGMQDNPDRLNLAGINLPGDRAVKNFHPYFFSLTAGLQFYHPIWNIGSINTYGGACAALGNPNMVSNDQAIQVYFQQNVFAFTPQIALERSFRNAISISVRAGPVIPISEKGGLRFSYSSWDSDHDSQNNYFVPGSKLDYIKLGSYYQFDSQFKDVPITSTPFHLSDWMISFRLTFSIR